MVNMSSTLSEDPNREIPNTESALPSRETILHDSELPMQK
jgi:hypothetical protein